MKVKKYFRYTILLIIVLITTNCSLDEKVYTFISSDNFYNNGEEAQAGVDGIYATIDGMYNQAAVLIGDLPTHIGYSDASGGADWDILEKMQYDPFSGSIDGLWNTGYSTINRANGLIAKIPDIIDINEGVRNRMLGESKFLRALAYFTLVRAYKNIVIKTEETTDLSNLNHSNEGTESKVYELIISDLMDAETKLPVAYSGNSIGRATSGAAKALLAKVYLQQSGIGIANNYDKAEAKAKEIIDSNIYKLFQGNYGDIWFLSNENKPEFGSIFEIQFTGGLTDNGLWNATGSANSTGTVWEGYQGLAGDPSFYDSWDRSDKRFNGTWFWEKVVKGKKITYPDPLFTYPGTVKYKAGFLVTVPERLGANIKILRFADVLLIHSEAVNESKGSVSDAYFGINKVRERAGLTPLSGLSKEELRQAIRRERELELCFEGHSLFDLQRYGESVFLEKVRKRYPNAGGHLMIMPIPQREVDNNNLLKQNPGYN